MSDGIICRATDAGNGDGGLTRDVQWAGARSNVETASAGNPDTSLHDSVEDEAGRGEDARKRIGWGERFRPRIADREARQRFSQICQKILCELDGMELAGTVVDGRVTDEGAGAIAEIANLLDAMFHCPFGEGESLKSVVVAVQSQTNNVEWTRRLIEFLRDVMKFLRVRYVLNDQTVDEVYQIMKDHDLDEFRGSVSDIGIRTRYHLVRVDDR